jgi:hypothetical protein
VAEQVTEIQEAQVSVEVAAVPAVAEVQMDNVQAETVDKIILQVHQFTMQVAEAEAKVTEQVLQLED